MSTTESQTESQTDKTQDGFATRLHAALAYATRCAAAARVVHEELHAVDPQSDDYAAQLAADAAQLATDAAQAVVTAYAAATVTWRAAQSTWHVAAQSFDAAVQCAAKLDAHDGGWLMLRARAAADTARAGMELAHTSYQDGQRAVEVATRLTVEAAGTADNARAVARRQVRALVKARKAKGGGGASDAEA